MVQRVKVNQEQPKQQQQQHQKVVDGLNRSDKSFKLISMLLLGSVLSLVFAGNVALAGQGCPFDDGSCREYCNQQGCNMGYCGHFAWIQCICRKCGDEWSWYDKVRYNPDKTVNQTELDSLKLNGTAPIILTNSSDQQQQLSQAPTQPNKPVAIENKQQTLTTLLIPDLSETNGKLELNDIPDENSDKFLDYLAKNHEKLVQATAARSADSSIAGSQQQQQQQPLQLHQTQNTSHKQILAGGIDLEEEHENQEEQDNQAPSSDETIEIQISTSNNNSNDASTLPKVVQQTQPTTSTSSSTSSQAPSASQKQQQQQQQQSESGSESESESQEQAMTKLLKMAVIERASEEID